MLELDVTNAVDYLRHAGVFEPGEAAAASCLAGGVSNVVLRVDSEHRSIVLKQSRAKLRTHADWFSNLDRIFREADVMRALRPKLAGAVVPEVLFEDRANFAFAMSAAPRAHHVWKRLLLNGQADQEIAGHAGDILGTIHATTAGDAQLAHQFSDHTVFIQLRVEPFYWRLRPIHPEQSHRIDAIVREMWQCRTALVHADFSPKNVLVHAQGVTLVDYETGHWGDPAFDLGFFLSHLVLKAIKHSQQRQAFANLTRRFWDRYRDRLRPVLAGHPALALGELTRRAIGHFSLCALARIDGTSPVDYLPEQSKRAAVRHLARELLDREVSCWELVLEQLNSLDP